MASNRFINYFQRELAYYRALTQEYVGVFPEVSYITSERGGDSAAERLFQGAAMLSARLRQRIEDDLPEVSHPVVSRLWPQYLRPVPAATLLCFRPIPRAVLGSQLIAQGTIVQSAATSSVPSCVFQTAGPLVLTPASLESVKLVRKTAGDLELRLRLDLGGGRVGDERFTLGVQLVGPDRERYPLYLWVRQAQSITLETPANEVLASLPGDRIESGRLSSDYALCAGEPTHIPDLYLLRDYFVLPDKYLSVELDLGRIPTGLSCVDVVLHLGLMADPEFEVGLEHFALGCIPAVNLSGSTQLNIAVTPGTHRFSLDAGEGDVFDVDRVRAYDRSERGWYEVPRLAQLGVGRPAEQGSRFAVLRLPEGVRGVQTSIVITDEEGRPRSPNTDLLQVWMSRTDGTLPAHLGADTINVSGPGTPAFAAFSNVIPVRPGRPLDSAHNLWNQLAQLTMHPFDLCSLNGLRGILDNARGDDERSSRHELLEVRSNLSSTVYRRTAVPLRTVELTFADTSFIGPGQLYIFAHLISRLFAPTAESLVFTEVTIRGEPSRVEHRFSLGPTPGGTPASERGRMVDTQKPRGRS